MYIRQRKSLTERISSVINQMQGNPDEHFVLGIHFKEAEGELPAEIIRFKREQVIEISEYQNKQTTDIRNTLISLYEELFLLEKSNQEEVDEATFKHLLFNLNMHTESLIKTKHSWVNSLVSEKSTEQDLSWSSKRKDDVFSKTTYLQPRLLTHTESELAMYNRVVEKCREQLKIIASRYPSKILQRWNSEFEEGRRQLEMTIN